MLKVRQLVLNFVVLGGWLLPSIASSVFAASIEEMTSLCAGCHGENGIPQEKTTPVIWGQTEGYLYLQLRDFKNGTRKNEVMSAVVATLEKEDMLQLATYFSNLEWPFVELPDVPKDIVDRAIAANVSVNCTGCHFDKWQGDGTVARLAGQNRAYLSKTISEFRDRSRGNNPGMSDLMRATSVEDLEALADYLSGLRLDPSTR